jgi:hypothetical protein
MTKAIELLENALWNTTCIYARGSASSYMRDKAERILREVIAELENKPRWETPEQYEKRTGEKWPDDWAVYTRAKYNTARWSLWTACCLAEARFTLYEAQIVRATEAGPPPDDDDWEPEEQE